MTKDTFCIKGKSASVLLIIFLFYEVLNEFHVKNFLEKKGKNS